MLTVMVNTSPTDTSASLTLIIIGFSGVSSTIAAWSAEGVFAVPLLPFSGFFEPLSLHAVKHESTSNTETIKTSIFFILL